MGAVEFKCFLRNSYHAEHDFLNFERRKSMKIINKVQNDLFGENAVVQKGYIKCQNRN